MKGCIKFWELMLFLWKVTVLMTDDTMTRTSYINQSQYSTGEQNQYSRKGSGPQTENRPSYSQTLGNEQRMCGSYMNGSTYGMTDYNVNGGYGISKGDMFLHGSQILGKLFLVYFLVLSSYIVSIVLSLRFNNAIFMQSSRLEKV